VSEILSIDKAGIFTDHRTVLFEFNTHRLIFDYAKGDFEGLRAALSAINLSSIINHEDINTDWQQWKDTFLAAVSDYIPSKRLKGRNPVPWINGAILNLINKKNHVRKKLKKSPTCYLKLQFKKLRSDIKNMLRESRKIFFKSMETEINKNPMNQMNLI
jgi:hypothetical protein